jgi:hypothetical protein
LISPFNHVWLEMFVFMAKPDISWFDFSYGHWMNMARL